MAKPRSPELARSGHTALDPDAPASTAPLQPDVGTAGAPDHLGPVPPDNRPSRSGRTDQDKPDLAAFARRLGIRRRSDRTADTSRSGTANTVADTSTDAVADPARSETIDTTGIRARLMGLPITATSLSLRATEMLLRRSADTVAALRRRVGPDDTDT
jgi:hypothetical protein